MKYLTGRVGPWTNSQNKYLNVAEPLAWRYGKKSLFKSMDMQWLL